MSDHDDLFYEHMAIVLAQLYECFPLKSDLDVRQISRHQAEEAQLAYATIEWLEAEGYIRVGWRYRHGFHNCVLTAQGLTRLQAKGC